MIVIEHGGGALDGSRVDLWHVCVKKRKLKYYSKVKEDGQYTRCDHVADEGKQNKGGDSDNGEKNGGN